jgi:hypothetical protein
MNTTSSFTPVFSSPSLLTESFTGTTLGSSQWVLGTSRVNTNVPFLTAQSGLDTAGGGALRLTTTGRQQAGFAFYNAPLATSGGLTIEFDFASYGGNGADGITFFLVDASGGPLNLSGAPGGSLGYATSRYSNHPGISGGYVAIAYDEFGGFSDPGNSAVGGPGQRPDSIAVRGSAANQYKYLTGTNTLPGGIDNPAANATRDNSTRRTKIDITSGGNLSVSIDLNGDRDYNDPGEAAIQNYNLAAANGALPGAVKLGFSASNGDQTNIHEIRNLTVGQSSGGGPITGGVFDIGGLGSALTYTENQAALVVAPGGTLSLGSKALERVSVRILGNYAAGQDQLTIAGQTGTSGTINGLAWEFQPTTGVLTLSGNGNLDAYQGALQQVAYLNGSENPSATPRTLEVALLARDGAIVTKNIGLNVIPVDDPAQLRVITQEGVQSGAVGATVGPVFVTDLDNTYNLAVSDSRFEIVSNGPNTGILKLKAGEAITAPTRITITGTDSSVSPAITFSQPIEIGVFTIPNPGGAITIGGLGGNTPTSYTTPNSPIFVARGINLGGGSGGNLDGAIVRIVGNGFNGGQESLGISGQTGNSGTVNGLSWLYNPANGTLTLSGAGSLTAYQNALQQVTYTAGAGATGDRAIQFIIGTGANAGAGNLIITFPNNGSATTIGGFPTGGFGYTIGGNPAAIASTLTLGGGSGTYDGATVTLSGPNVNLSQDRLGIVGQTGNSGTVDGLTWTYNPATGVLTLSGAGNAATYQSALQKVSYSNSSDNPAVGPRTISYAIGTGPNGGSGSTAVNLSGASLAVGGLPTGGFSYTAGGAASPIASTLTLSGGAGSTISGATVTLSGPNVNFAQDRLGIAGQTGNSGTVDGLTWSYNPATGVLTLSGSGSAAAYQSALQKVTYSNSATEPAAGPRSVAYSITSTTPSGSSSASGALSINVANSLPNSGLGGFGNGLSYTIGAAPGTIAAGLTVTAPTGSQFNGASVSIGTNFAAGQDRLGIAGQTGTSGTINGLNWSYNADTGVLTFSGAGDAAAYQSALRQVTYSNTSTTPSRLPRTLTFNLGGATGASGTAIVNFTAANAAPTAIALSNTSVGYAATGAIVGNLTTTDTDSTAFNYTVSDSRFEVVGGQLKLKAGQTIAAPTAVDVTAYDGVIGATGTQSFTQSFNLVPRLPEIFLRDYNTSADSALFYINNANALSGIRYLSITAGQTAAERFRLPTKWRAEAVGDINRDGINDVIYRNTTNGEQTAFIAFLGEGGRVIGQDFVKINNTAVAIADNANWQIKGLSDMNGDGSLDIVWHNAEQDSTAIWYLPGDNSTNLVEARFVARGGADAKLAAPGTRLVGVGDFDGDGRAELLFRNNVTDRTTLWKLNGSEVAQEQVLIPTAQAGWDIKLVADFNNDGRADILWQNTRLDSSAIWISAAGTTGTIVNNPGPGSIFLPKPGANWSFEAVADFNNDGTNDVVLRNKVTDTLRIWTMRDGQVLADNVVNNGTSTFVLGNPEWDVEGAGQFGSTPA